MKKIILILILIFILSCKDKMSNDDIIVEVTKYREAEMGYKLLHENVGAVITSVQCTYGQGE